MTNPRIDPIYEELAAKFKFPVFYHYQMPENECQIPNAIPKIIRKIANLQQAKIVREMPGSAADIAQKLGLDVKVVEVDIDDLFNKGLVAPTKRGWNMPASWGLLQDMIGSASPKYIDEELKLLFRELFAEQSERKLKYYELNKDNFTMPYIFQVIPKWRTIKDLPGIMPCEDTRSIFKRSKQIVIINCPCKTWYPRTEECKVNIPHESCIVGLGVARYEMKRGTGREISYEECMDILDCLDQQQIVQTSAFTNSQSVMPYGVCNCHPCCCGFFVGDRFNQSHINPNFSAIAPSRYSAETDPAKCIACKKCIDTRCPFGAITMQYFPEFKGVRACVDEAKCKGCGLCVLTCPSKAKRMKVVRPPEFIPDVTQFIAQQNSGSGNEEFFI